MGPDQKTAEPEATASSLKLKGKRSTRKGVDGTGALEAKMKEIEAESSNLKKALEDAKKALDEKNKEYLYLRADFDNYRKGIDKRLAEFKDIALENALRGVLDISENLERLKEHVAKEADMAKVKEGIDSVFNHMCTFLAASGVQEMKAVGERFDPMRHEALMEETSTKCDDGTVSRVLQKGYLLNGKVMRPAKVCVARKIEPKPEPEPKEKKKEEKKEEERKKEVQAQQNEVKKE
jgi:molecular chaperone GrpE